MATPKTPAPLPSSAGQAPSSIAESGASLIRLWVAAFTLPITVANAVGTTLVRVASNAASALDGNPPAVSDNEIVRATGNLVKAGVGLYESVVNAAANGLESLARTIDTAAAGTREAPRK